MTNGALSKNILILSYGPVPTPEYKTIEGGGMRAWGLAKGLQSKGHNVTVAMNEGFPQTVKSHESISLANWTLNDTFKDYINSFDAVIVSYCAGDLSMFVADNLNETVTLILDCYVPIFIEVSARNSADKNTELVNYAADLPRFNHVLRRGDYFLCANAEQFDLYTGTLSSLGVINPATYHDDRIFIVPFGIHKNEISAKPDKAATNPYVKLGIKKDAKVLLWFGGLYPWFNFEPMLQAVEKASEQIPDLAFVIVGGKNPFNSHPDFIKQHDFVQAAVNSSDKLKSITHFVDWVDYDTRTDWYQHADMVVSINSDGKENHYAWRTRIMDYLTSSLPILTNGGDPLSDFLIDNDAAIKIDPKNLSSQLTKTFANPNRLKAIKDNLTSVANGFYWDDVVTPIDTVIKEDRHPYIELEKLSKELGVDLTQNNTKNSHQTTSAANTRVAILKKYYHKARNKGLRRSVKFAAKIGLSLAKTKLQSKSPRQPYVFLLSHPIDETGAPTVLLDLANDFSKHYDTKHINIVAPGILPYIQADLRRKGFNLHKMAMGISKRLIHAQLAIQPNDFVLMNTVALYDDYKEYVYWLLETDKLKQATWFIHEDKPKLRFKNKAEIRRIHNLIEQDKLTVHVPSQQTAEDYNQFFDTTKVKPTILRVDMDKKYLIDRTESDFGKINFVMSGTPEDGRKGQLLFLAALQYFEANLKNPKSKYRDYQASLIAIGDDYISQQIKVIGEAVLGKRLHIYKKMPRNDALDIVTSCNVTVCTSLNESFALFVAEGMAMGHPIIRNKASGWQEQIQDGKNGYLYDDTSLEDLASKIEKVLNKSTSNKSLQTMGAKSQHIVEKFLNANYYNQIK